MTGANVTLASVGQTTQVDVVGTYSDGSTKDITNQVEIQSSNVQVASVALVTSVQNGLFAAWAPGVTIITALKRDASNFIPAVTSTVTVLNGPPPEADLIPTLISPTNGAVLPNLGGIWSFSWSAVPGATDYHLQVQNQSALFPVVDMPGIFRPSWDVAAGNTGGSNLQGWQWWVQADVRGVYQAWSQRGAFSVQPMAADLLARRPNATRALT